MENKKVVLICENSGHQLNIVDKKEYILEGIFCVFNKENVNGRIYEEAEYFPHLEYLQEKISKRKLVGELDHPENFDISLQKVSHLVEKLWYDKEDQTLKGRIRILDTDPHGLNARKLVDAGFPISVSSRAAGVVQENKKVKIKRVFTYDFVADGGFGDAAEMKRVSESLGFEFNDSKNNSNLKLINEELGLFSDDNIKVYDVTDKYPNFINEENDFSIFDYSIVKSENKNEYIKKNNNMKEDFVTVSEMTKYSQHVKEEIAKIEEMLKSISEKVSQTNEDTSIDSSEKVSIMEEEITKLKEANTSLQEEIKKIYEWSNTITEDHNHLASYTEKIAEDHNHLANYTERIVEDHNHVANYITEKIHPMLENVIGYSETVAEKANIGLNYIQEIVVNELQHTQDYINNELSEKLNVLWNYNEYLSEKVEEVTQYAKYIGETASTRKDLENVIGFAEAIQESIATNPTVTEKLTEPQTTQPIVKVQETVKPIEIQNNSKLLIEKIDGILANIKNEKMSEAAKFNSQFDVFLNAAKTNPQLNQLNQEQIKKYITLTESQKQQLNNKLTENVTVEDISRIFEKVECPVLYDEDKWINLMPANIKPLWESAESSTKESITRQSKLYTLDTEYQIRYFWNTRVNQLSNESTKINESVITNDETVATLGYSSDYVKNIMSRL
jgi:hypothetical protein